MKKSIKLIIVLFMGIIIGITCFTYASTYNSEEITYDNSISGSTKTNVKDAVDELYNHLGKCPNEYYCRNKTAILKMCIRALELHVQGGKIFGSIGTTGTLTAGDAFDCDVNDDGIYDGEKERFYYITDLESDNSKAVLLYYSNTSGGVATPSKTIAYNEELKNTEGPVTVVADLPSTSKWVTRIYSNPRQITNEKGGTTTDDGTIVSYDYGDRAARLITMQELRSACGRTDNMNNTGNLDTCTYTMENTTYADTSLPKGYWIETPTSGNSFNVWYLNGSARFIYDCKLNLGSSFGARPAIEVPKSDIAY